MIRPNGQDEVTDGRDVGPAKRSQPTSWARWFILLGLLLPFSTLTYLAVRTGSPGDIRDRPVILTTLGTITGPFTGAIARNGQSCCLDVSLKLAAICGPILALGVVAQFVPLPSRRGEEVLRLGFWTLGWSAWLLGAVASFPHALG
jgi:hypothetical protein